MAICKECKCNWEEAWGFITILRAVGTDPDGKDDLNLYQCLSCKRVVAAVRKKMRGGGSI